jgi:hypothetical protein
LTSRSYSDEELEAAVSQLTDPKQLQEAQDLVARSAPGLQRVLNQALHEGGWFGEVHDAELLKAATLPDIDERLQALRVLVAEEVRLGMFVGVAVGYALAERLAGGREADDDD